MWEIIRSNKRKSVILFISMGVCLILLGYLIGAVFFPPYGGINGIFISIFIWVILSAISYFSGDSILLSLSGAKEVTHDVHPQLFNIVEEMKIAANLADMPKVYIIPEAAPNAFATGIKPSKSAIAVTAGLLSALNRDELQGVVAHEMSHISNRDVLFMSFAGIMLGSIVLVSEVFLRSMWFSSGSSRRYKSSSSKGGAQGQAIILIVAIVFAILSPIIARLLYFAMSRKREYLADASAARLTRYPAGLASALEGISTSKLDLSSANKVTAPMYIINPMKVQGMAHTDLSSTHPPTSERIRILRGMHQGVNYLNYQEVYSSVRGGKDAVIPPSALRDTGTVTIRKPFAEPEKAKANKDKVRDVGDLIRAVNNYIFISCLCGLKIKVPPDFKNSKLSCPKCGRVHEVPLSQMKEIAAAASAATALSSGKNTIHKTKTPEGKGPQVYARQGTGWESFGCNCGKVVQLSPAFSGSHIVCSSCKQSIKIES